MLIDSHAHLDDEKFHGNIDEIIKEATDKELKLIINPAVDLESSKKSIRLADKYSMIYAALGVHPHEVKNIDNDTYDEIIKLTEHPKVVGIGEIGLDYYYEYSPRELQIKSFHKQIEIAQQLKLPIIVHSRDAHEDTYNVLYEHRSELTGVLHSYSGSWEMAKKYLDMGMYISFSGPITFNNARKLPQVAQNVPMDRLLIETDSPYLTPVPYRGKTNHPAYVNYVALKICEIKGCNYEWFIENIENNVYNLFKKI